MSEYLKQAKCTNIPRNIGLSMAKSQNEDDVEEGNSNISSNSHSVVCTSKRASQKVLRFQVVTTEGTDRQLAYENSYRPPRRKESRLPTSKGRSVKDLQVLQLKISNWTFKEKPSLELSWTDVNMTNIQKQVNSQKNIAKENMILKGISGKVQSGEALAIIGSSGAGKTTLLNLLSGKIESKNLKFSGDILLNGCHIDRNKFKSISAYVTQDDILEDSMTPTEILMFTAKLKLNLSTEETEQTVFKMMKDLNLMRCKDTPVGNHMIRGVSGGERKRTSIGVELISDPRIIFLDEPTTGLDAFNAYEIIDLLRQIASTGRIVIFTIHQPSSEILDLLDKLCIMALGTTVYFGVASKCFNAFEAFKMPVPFNYNPFEHFLETTTQQAVSNEDVLENFTELEEISNLQERYRAYIEIISGIYENNKHKYLPETPLLKEISPEIEKMMVQKEKGKGFLYEFGLLVSKNTIVTMRKPKPFMAKFFQVILTSIFIAMLYNNVHFTHKIRYQADTQESKID